VKRIASLLLALGIAALAAVAGAPVEVSAQPPGSTPLAEGSRAPEAPESLRRFVLDLPPEERRPAIRRLRRMDPERRANFFERWEGGSEAERLELWESLQTELAERGAGEPRPVLPSELREEFRGMSAGEREQAREVLRALPLERRARLRRAIRRWDELTPEQREKVRGHAQRLRRLSEERRERIERNLRIWQEMDRADRERMRRRLERFRSLPAWQQEALVDERFGNRTAEQRARILDRLRNQ
jgi:hypothetical protein